MEVKISIHASPILAELWRQRKFKRCRCIGRHLINPFLKRFPSDEAAGDHNCQTAQACYHSSRCDQRRPEICCVPWAGAWSHGEASCADSVLAPGCSLAQAIVRFRQASRFCWRLTAVYGEPDGAISFSLQTLSIRARFGGNCFDPARHERMCLIEQTLWWRSFHPTRGG